MLQGARMEPDCSTARLGIWRLIWCEIYFDFIKTFDRNKHISYSRVIWDVRTRCLPPHSHQTELSPLHRRENSGKKEGFNEHDARTQALSSLTSTAKFCVFEAENSHLNVISDPLECQSLVIQTHVTWGLVTAEIQESECSNPDNRLST